MPDIDIDFDDSRREEVLNYLRRKYGRDSVAQVITYNNYKTKNTLRDAGKIFRLEQSEINNLADAVPEEVESDPIDEVLEESPEMRKMARSDDRIEKTFRAAGELYGMESHTGKHPAAAVVTPGKITDYVPTTADTNNDGDPITLSQFDGDFLEDLGLLKIDVLGLKTLRTIRSANDIVEDRTGQRVPQEALDARDDPKVYEETFAQGDTIGIFQFQSGGMRRFLDKMNPTEFKHITAMVALYRPGPMELIPSFIKRMHGEEPVYYLDESIHNEVKGEVDDILDDTYGIMVFQEQVMQVCQRLAGFSLGDADIMRRAIGKKKEKLLQEQREKFLQGCQSEGHSKSFGEKIFSLIEEFADYGFNRCVPGDTRIHGNDKTVGELFSPNEVGEEPDSMAALSLDIEEEETVENEILTITPNGERDVYEVTVTRDSGETYQMEATGNHRFPCRLSGPHVKKVEDGVGTHEVGMPNGEVKKRTLKEIGGHADDFEFLVRAPGSYTDERVSTEAEEDPPMPKTFVWAKVTNIEHVGVKETYDVTMAQEPNNFIAGDGIVTCNSHAAAYAAIAYYQAYFKAHHPVAFYTAALRTEDDEDKQVGLIQDAKSHGIEILPPSVNESGQEFTAVPGKQVIRFGLGTIKNVGKQAQKIIDEREKNGPYDSFMNFCERAIPNLRAVKSLIKVGGMDCFGLSRKAMYDQKDEIMTYVRKMRDYRTGDRVSEPEKPDIEDKPEWPAKMRFQQERDIAEIYTTGQPVDRFPGLVESFQGETYRRSRQGKPDREYTVRCGSILSISEATTSNGNKMWWLRLRMRDGVYEKPTFGWCHKHIKDKLEKDVPLAIVGQTDLSGEYEGMTSIMNVMPLEEVGLKEKRSPRRLIDDLV